MKYSPLLPVILLLAWIAGFTSAAHAQTLSGTRSVGPTGNYSTLTAAVADIQAKTLGGPLILELQPTYDSSGETYPLVFTNLTTTPTRTLTVRPKAGAASLTITSTAASTVRLDGADYVIFDGRSGGAGTTRNLTVENTSTSGVAVELVNDASGNTIRHMNLRGVNSSTTAGVVYFGGAAGGGVGNDDNTIDSCDIAPASGTTLATGVFSQGTLGAENSGNTIRDCAISDFFNPTFATNGVYLWSGNSAWTITGNQLFQTASRTFTTAYTHAGIRIYSGSGHTISDNVIGFASAAGTGAWTIDGSVSTRFIGIDLAVGASPATSVQGNTITGFAMTTNSGANTSNGVWCGINVLAGDVNIGTVSGNTIGSATDVDAVTVTSSIVGALVTGIALSTPGTAVVQWNTIGGLTSLGTVASVGSSVAGVNVTNGAAVTIAQNIIGNSAAHSLRGGTSGVTTGNSTASGIMLPTLPTACTISDNAIQNLTANGTGSTAFARGIWTQANTGVARTATITGNVVRDVQSNGALTGVANGLAGALGIHVGAGTNCVISRNTIYNIARTNTGTGAFAVVGIASANATNTTISANVIRDLSNAGTGTTPTTPPLAAGVLIRSGTTSVNVVNNMISLGVGQSTDTAFVGIMGNHGSTPDPVDRIYHNTVFIGGDAGAGTLNTFAFHRGDFSTTTRTATVDVRNNILINARTGAGAAHCAIGNNSNATASATGWPAGASDFNVLTGGASATGWWNAAVNFADWKTASASDASSLSGVTVDFVNAANDLHLAMTGATTQLESGGATIASVTEDFDAQPRPGPTASVHGGALAPDIGADEFDGVPLDVQPPVITHTPLPGLRLGWNYFEVRVTDRSGTDTTFIPSVTYRKIGAATWSVRGSSLVSGTAQDGTWQFAIVLAPEDYAPGDVVEYYLRAQDVAGNVSRLPAGETNPPPTRFTATVHADLSGTRTVGAGGDFPTLTAAVAEYNAGTIAGPVVFELTDATYPSETFPIVIRHVADASATNTLTIKPAAGVSATISSGFSASAVIQFDGARYVTIDGHNGTTQNSLNPRVSASRDLTLENTNASTAAAVVWLSTSDTHGGASHCTVQNCHLVGSAALGTGFGIVASGATTSANGTQNDELRFINNSVRRCRIAISSTGFDAALKNSGLVVQQNEIGAVAPDEIGVAGIVAQFTDGITVAGNRVGNIANGISLDVSGISAGFGTSFSATTSGVADGVSNVTITGNTLDAITQSNTFSAVGIALGETASGTSLIANNMISGVASNGTNPDIAAGILLGGGAGTVRVFHNTVAMQTPVPGADAATQTSACLAVTATSEPPALDVRNNIFTNTQTGNTGATLRIAAIALRYTPSGATSFSDYNALYSAGAGPGTYTTAITGSVVGGTNRVTLADWQAASGQDAHSIEALPAFVSGTDLHLAAESFAGVGKGATLAAVTTDFDFHTRNAPPDIGADEFSPSTNANLASIDVSGFSIHPGFDKDTLSYTVSVPIGQDEVDVTATAERSIAGIRLGTDSPWHVGSVSFSQRLESGDNVVPFTVRAQDEATTKSYTLTIHRNAAPEITLPGQAFFALAPDLGGVVVNFTVTASDLEDGALTPTVNPPSGSVFAVGNTNVSISATDSDGVTVNRNLSVQVRLAEPLNSALVTQGAPAPNAGALPGVPVDAVVTSFGVPAIDDFGKISYVASWGSATGGSGRGLFQQNRCLARIGGDVPGLLGGAKFRTFSDPVGGGGHVAFLATFTGVAPSNAAGVLTGDHAALEVIAQSGGAASNAGGANWKAFQAVAIDSGDVAFSATLVRGTGVPTTTAANDSGIWLKDGATAPVLALRKGQRIGTRTVAAIVAFKPGAGSPGQGRGTVVSGPGAGPRGLALVIFTDKTQALVSLEVDGPPIVLSQARSTTDGPPDITGATFASYSFPARNAADQRAFLATLAGPGITTANARGIFLDLGLGKYEPIVRIGEVCDVGGAKFSVLRDPVLASDGGIAFPATIAGNGVTSANATTLWWQPSDAPRELLARAGSEPPGVPRARWKSFPSLAILEGGPIFTATMVPGFGGVTTANASGVWAMDSLGQLRLLFRTGQTLNGKPLKSFALLNALPGVTGSTRSINDTAQITWRATFTDNTTAVLTTQIP